jgi:hypothetical protein
VSQGIKKWYSIQLTAEEIAISLRNGFIVLGIGPVRMSYCRKYSVDTFLTLTFCQPNDDYQNAFVDAVEVYATDRDTVAKWLPKSLRSPVSQDLQSMQDSPPGSHRSHPVVKAR